MPVREIKATYCSLTGKFASRKMDRFINWESALERDFYYLAEYAGITSLVLDLSRSGLPYWLKEVAETQMNLDRYKINLDEFESALRYINMHHLPYNKTQVAKALGLDVSIKFTSAQTELFLSYEPTNRSTD